MNILKMEEKFVPNNTNQILDNNQSEEVQCEDIYASDIEEIPDEEISEDIKDEEINSDDSAEKIEIEDANTTNCLALTIKKDHHLVAIQNVFLHSLKVTWKVIASTIILHIIKLFLK